MILSTEIIEECTKLLTSVGASDIHVTKGGKHPRVNFTYQDKTQFYVVPGTPSDSYSGTENCLSGLRHFLGLIKPEKRVGERRKKRNTVKVEKKIDLPDLKTIQGEDWREKLEHSNLGIAALPYRADRAWIEWFREILLRQGHVMVTK
jgi:hypothetical protein